MKLSMATMIVMLGCVNLSKAADSEWIELLSGKEDTWKKIPSGWIYAADATLNPDNPKRLKAIGEGSVWVNGEQGRLPNLVTRKQYGDCEVHLEFLIAKGSNAGFKFHEVYEIQILDSAAVPSDQLSGDSCGGIYPRAELLPRYRHLDKGIPPRVNAAKPAGEWQAFDVIFQAARFDAEGKKIAHAKIVRALLNGQLIHEEQEMTTPTGHNYTKKEEPIGSFLLQNDHGPVAWRNVRIRPISR